MANRTPDPGIESEWLTRKRRIDPLLDAGGWPTKGHGKAGRTEEEETAHGPADYALWLDGRVVGIVEAKKLTIGPQNVLTQAERYACGLEGTGFDFDGIRCPFLYATNGEVIRFHDVRHGLNRSRQVKAFHTKGVLAAACSGRLTEDWRADRRGEMKGKALGELPEIAARLTAKLRRIVDRQGRPETDTDLPEGWESTRVAALLREPPLNGTSPPGSDTPPGVAALRLNALADDGLDYTAVRYIPIDEVTAQQLAIVEGDFFVARGNGSLDLAGRGALAARPPVRTVFPDTMIRLRFHEDALARWVSTIWPAPLVRSQYVPKTTAGIWKISQPDVLSLCLPFPPREERAEIVRRAGVLPTLGNTIEHRLAATAAHSNRLPQAILGKAFRGDLGDLPPPGEEPFVTGDNRVPQGRS